MNEDSYRPVSFFNISASSVPVPHSDKCMYLGCKGLLLALLNQSLFSAQDKLPVDERLTLSR